MCPVGYTLVIPRVGVYAVPKRLIMPHFPGGLDGQREICVALPKRGLLEADQVKERWCGISKKSFPSVHSIRNPKAR